jgi:hypothetical protein
MSATRGMLRSLAEACCSPGEVLTQLNQLLVNDFPAGKFVTMVYAVLNPVSRNVIFANAGHLRPLLIDEKGEQFLDVERGLPLGLSCGDYSETEISLSKGSRLVFYSDGIRWTWFVEALIVLGLVVLAQRARVRSLVVYVVLGVAAWLFVFESGVHATIAGVVLGLLTPAKPLLPEVEAEAIVDQLEGRDDLTADDVRRVEFLVRESVPPTERLEHALHPWTSYVVVPLFAFAGSLAAVALVWRLARVGGARPPATLLLAGITLAFVCSAASMLVQFTASFQESYRIVRWMMGGLDWIPGGDLARSSAVVGAGLVLLVLRARDLNALAAGSEAAASVGVRVELAVGIGYLAASLSRRQWR